MIVAMEKLREACGTRAFKVCFHVADGWIVQVEAGLAPTGSGWKVIAKGADLEQVLAEALVQFDPERSVPGYLLSERGR